MNTPEDFLFEIEYTRKPCLTEDVTTEVDCMNMTYENIHMLLNLPYISIDRFAIQGFFTDVFEEYINYDDEGNKIYHPQFWITGHKGEWYLIDNQGYNYARYVIRLKNYERVKNGEHVL